MSVIGPVYLRLGTPGVDFGDYVTSIQQTAPAAVTLAGINRDFSESPSRGYGITLTGVAEDLTEGTLWRYLWDNFNNKDVPVLWSPHGDGTVYFEAVITSIPDPAVGGQANQHGTFDITLPLEARPTIVAAPTP